MAKTQYQIACATAAKRKQLCAETVELAVKLGAECEVGEDRDRETTVFIKRGGYKVMIDFDGASRVDCFLAHWHTTLDSNVRYPKTFGVTCGGSVNECHYGKATTFAVTFPLLLELIERGFGALEA